MFEKVSWEIAHFLLRLCCSGFAFAFFFLHIFLLACFPFQIYHHGGYCNRSNSSSSTSGSLMFDASNMKSIFVYIESVVIPFLLIKSNPILLALLSFLFEYLHSRVEFTAMRTDRTLFPLTLSSTLLLPGNFLLLNCFNSLFFFLCVFLSLLLTRSLLSTFKSTENLNWFSSVVRYRKTHRPLLANRPAVLLLLFFFLLSANFFSVCASFSVSNLLSIFFVHVLFFRLFSFLN